MNNNEQVKAKDLVRMNHYASVSSADNALHRVRQELGIPKYGKVFWWQYVTVFNSGVSLIKLIQIFNKANSDIQWRQIKESIIKGYDVINNS